MLEKGAINILAVDDEPICLDIINFALTSAGYKVYTVNSGEEAIGFLRSSNYKIDLILLDMMMPQSNGIEVLRQIRQMKQACDIPVIFQTGATECTNSLMKNIIRKPYKRAELLQVVQDVILKGKDDI